MALRRPIDVMLCISAVYAVENCLSIRLSHTWYYVETATCINSSLSAVAKLAVSDRSHLTSLMFFSSIVGVRWT